MANENNNNPNNMGQNPTNQQPNMGQQPMNNQQPYQGQFQGQMPNQGQRPMPGQMPPNMNQGQYNQGQFNNQQAYQGQYQGMPPKKKKGKLIAIVVALLAIIAIVGGYAYHKHQQHLYETRYERAINNVTYEIDGMDSGMGELVKYSDNAKVYLSFKDGRAVMYVEGNPTKSFMEAYNSMREYTARYKYEVKGEEIHLETMPMQGGKSMKLDLTIKSGDPKEFKAVDQTGDEMTLKLVDDDLK